VVNLGEGLARTPSAPPDMAMDQRVLYDLYLEGELRGYYDGRLPSPAEIQDGLASGRLVVDRRLADFLARPSGDRDARHPDAAAASSVTAATLGFAAAVDLQKTLESELAETQRQLAEARADVATLAGRGDELRDALAREGDALAALRASRLVRYSRVPRRLYYRARDALRRDDGSGP
jgi:hypothetical protein